jgi:hypothetical protein
MRGWEEMQELRLEKFHEFMDEPGVDAEDRPWAAAGVRAIVLIAGN